MKSSALKRKESRANQQDIRNNVYKKQQNLVVKLVEK